MDTLKILLPLLGVLVGALLTGLSSLLKAHAERKKAIAIALSDLLEVRHYLVGIDVVLADLKQRFNPPAELLVNLQATLEQFFPIDEEVHKRYGGAIDLLAGIDPLLAFRLRSKNSLPQFFRSLNALADANGAPARDASQFIDFLRKHLVPTLDDALIELAGEHSWRTKRKVLQHIEHSRKMPSKLIKFFEDAAVYNKTIA